MDYYSIGKNIRKYRVAKKLRQEDLAEKVDLSTNYLGAIERGEKIPSLETFIAIVNALGVSADQILADVIDIGYTVKNSILSEKMESASEADRRRIFDVVEVLLKHADTKKPQ